jgi:hypothetical protein
LGQQTPWSINRCWTRRASSFFVRSVKTTRELSSTLAVDAPAGVGGELGVGLGMFGGLLSLGNVGLGTLGGLLSLGNVGLGTLGGLLSLGNVGLGTLGGLLSLGNVGLGSVGLWFGQAGIEGGCVGGV